jgi:accessory colonization factor AcfC
LYQTIASKGIKLFFTVVEEGMKVRGTSVWEDAEAQLRTVETEWSKQFAENINTWMECSHSIRTLFEWLHSVMIIGVIF